VRDRITRTYGIDAQVLPPPHSADPDGSLQPVEGMEPGAWLMVSRLLPYKNVDVALNAFRSLPSERLVVVGRGPDEARLLALAPPNVRFVGSVAEEQLRWLYRQAPGLLGLAYEDYGLTPLEAAAHGTPSVVLRWGGYLDTVRDGETGVYLDALQPAALVEALERLRGARLPRDALRAHAERFDGAAFSRQLQDVVLRDAA